MARKKSNRRDEFATQDKDVLARRVGMRCSNPNCRQPTSGPQDDPRKAVNVGVAAHITAAAPGGPRYDAKMTREERAGIDNAIWLCQNCAKLVDNDAERFTPDLLRRWKRLSEDAARLDVESPGAGEVSLPQDDLSLIRFYAQCFDRPAFQDYFHREGSMEAFDRAIEDTITALNTGCLRSRDGAILQRSKGKAFLTNPKWRDQMDTIVDLLRAIRSRYITAVAARQIVTSAASGGSWYCINDPGIAYWMDVTRSEALQLFGQVCQEAGVQAPVFPRLHPRRR